MDNLEILEKTFETGLLNYGGQLEPEQQDQYIVYVKKHSRLLRHVRFVRMNHSRYEVDKLHVNEPVTECIDENSTSGNNAVGRFNRIELLAEKLRSAWNISYEWLKNNIERGRGEDTIMDTFSNRIATDLELVAIQGDSSIVLGPNSTPTDRLLSCFDGWDILTESAHKVDAQNNPVNFDLFSRMMRELPSQFKTNPNLKWVMSDIILNDWLNELSARLTNAGDAAIGGMGLKPLNKEIIDVPLIPSDKPLSIDAATPAEVVGTRFGPFEITTGTNDVIFIDINNGGARTITVPAGVWETVVIAQIINTVFLANGDTAFADDHGDGNLRIRTTNTGVAAEIEITAATAADTLLTYGFSAAVTLGSDAGSSGVLKEGSFIWLLDPQHLVFGMCDGTRYFTKYNPDYDRTETRVYNSVAVNIDNPDSIVKAYNVRRKPA